MQKETDERRDDTTAAQPEAQRDVSDSTSQTEAVSKAVKEPAEKPLEEAAALAPVEQSAIAAADQPADAPMDQPAVAAQVDQAPVAAVDQPADAPMDQFAVAAVASVDQPEVVPPINKPIVPPGGRLQAPPPPPPAAKEYLANPAPDYGVLFYDHLYSEYLALAETAEKQAIRPVIDAIHEKRRSCQLTWSDIYAFDLTLLNIRPLQNLIRKAYDVRSRYRNIAGQKEYDEYIASKPPDLAAVPAESAERLRADISYLLNKFYLYYCMLPVRERLRDILTLGGVGITAAAVLAIGFAIAINVGDSNFLPGRFSSTLNSLKPYSVVLVTVLTVTLAGIVGGCVSMLQRIQSAPSEGDALFNMTGLKNGWRGIVLSPLYGGIFSSLLFVLFAGGILKGSIFPVIDTPARPSAEASPSPTPISSPGATPTPSPLTIANAPAAAGGLSTAGPGTPPPKETPNPPPSSPTPIVVSDEERGVLQIKDFLSKTGPNNGTSYALLIIWSFIAGFAERLVPDTLNRLVAKNEAIQGK
jgi:hypothetical protein